MNSKIYHLFPTTVGLYQNPNNVAYTDLKTFLEEKMEVYQNSNFISKNPNLKEFYQTSTGIHKLKYLEDLNNIVTGFVLDYLLKCNYNVSLEDLYIADCWANISTGNSTTHIPHTHSNSLISAVYFLSAPQGSSSLYFLHPCMQVNSLDPDHKITSIENSSEFAIEPENGQCAVFKSSTIHGTSSNSLISNNRISIAYTFNIKQIGKNSLFSHYEK
jgi:uncharacterized protein (TIGR02466 family)